MKPLIATMVLLIALAIPATSHADYWMVYVKYKCPIGWVTAPYKRRSLKAARQTQEMFRKIPKYRNCWIRFIKEQK